MAILKKSRFLLLFFIIFLVGCEVSKEEAIQHAQEIFHTSFEQEQIVGEIELKQLHLNLPAGIEIVEETDYNLLLERNGQLFLLFFNPLESSDSEVNFLHDQEIEKESYLFEKLDQEGKLGYLSISPYEEEQLKVIVGLGGAKITTIANPVDVRESVQISAEILHSISY